MDLRLLASQIATIHNKFLSETNLKQNRTFYLCYSYLFEFILASTFPDPIRQIPPDEFQNPNNQDYAIREMPSDEFNWQKISKAG